MKFSSTSAALAWALLAPFVRAGLDDSATSTDVMPTGLQAPLPTPGPHFHELLRRQDAGDTSFEMLAGTGRTCGFLSGYPGAGLACDVSSTCGFSPDLGARFCCDDIECEAFLFCMGAAAAADPLSCDDVCQANQFMLKCKSSAPYCRTLVYPSGITDYDCVTTSRSSRASAEFTYDGWSLDFPLETMTWVVSDGTTTIISDKTTSVIGQSETLPPDPLTSSPTPPPPPPSPTPRPSSNNTGAIVGGTVGGLAVLGLVGVALFFILRKKKGPPPGPAPQEYLSPRASTMPQSPSDAGTYWSSPGHLSVGQDPKFQVVSQMNQVLPAGYNPIAQAGVQHQQGGYTAQQQQTGPVYEAPVGVQGYNSNARDGRIQFVAASKHGGYDIRHISDVHVDGEHPKIVYHKDGGSTHAFRFANSNDDNIENHKGRWFRGAVVSWNGFPNEDIRYRMANNNWGSANFDLREGGSPHLLGASMPAGITFDRFRDDASPGWP